MSENTFGANNREQFAQKNSLLNLKNPKQVSVLDSK